MPQTTTISLRNFTSTVQAAVKAAVAKHPKFKVDPPQGMTMAYLIRGIPIPEGILSQVTVGETQAFASEIASHLAGAHPGAVAGGAGHAGGGAVLCTGGHCVVGIPPAPEFVQFAE